jgi:hexosaminidase
MIAKFFTAISCTLFSSMLLAQTEQIHIIPQPASMTQSKGTYTLSSPAAIGVTQATAMPVAKSLQERLQRVTGYPAPIQKNGQIRLELLSQADTSLGKEGYQLSVTTTGVTIRANEAAGLFYGCQSLYQLLPPEIESTTKQAIKWAIPYVQIKDKPRFGWRGLMLDVSRHFFTKQEVKQFIDEMVKYKFNRLHLHLTDDQGWRIEIKSLPQLTNIGAWRPLREGKWANGPDPKPGEAPVYGGYYSHEDIRELVAYASEREVSILPEIDIPGHSMAMLAAIPNLSATPGTEYRVNASERFMEWPAGGHFYGLKDNNLSPANEQVYVYLDKIFTEVAMLFPFEYIHMGGDEAARNFWEKSTEIQELMKRENLKNLDEVQSYFVRRVEKIILSKGKKLMGWDEILEGGLAPSAAVMSWRGMKGGIEAAKMKHPVVMSPTDFAYLDYYQGEKTLEPPVYAGLRLQKSYQLDPAPAEIDEQYVLGAQGNLWTEQLPNMRSVQYMIWPRAMAIAEVSWTKPAQKNWNGFVKKVEHHFSRLDMAGTKYAKTMYDPIIKAKMDNNGKLALVIEKEIADMDVHFSINETNPDHTYPLYTGPYTLPYDVATVKMVSYRNGKQVGRQINITVEELKKRVSK